MVTRPQTKKGQANPAAGAPSRGRDGGKSGGRPRLLLIGIVVALAAAVPYTPSARYEFVWDGLHVVGPHLDLRGPRDVARIWGLPFDEFLKNETTERTYYRPVTLLSLALDRAKWDSNPMGFHRSNLLYYVIACCFLWLFAMELSGRPVAAAAGAVLFALHPTHPESVCFVSGRTDVLAGAFLFAALWAAVRFGPTIRSPWLKLLPAAVLLLPGLFAKEVAFLALPLVPIALWIKDRRATLPTLLRASVPVAADALVYVGARAAVLGLEPLRAAPMVEGTTAQVLTSVAAVARYLPLLVAPLHLSARHQIVETRTPDLIFVGGLLILLAIG